MKLKMIGSIVGVFLAIGIIGVGTIWAQSAGTANTPSIVIPGAQSNGAPDTQSLDATNALTGTAAACDQYMQALAQHLGVTVDKLAQAGKDAAKDMIDQAVKNGRLTPDQATAAKQRIDQAQGGCGLGFGFGRFGGRGNRGVRTVRARCRLGCSSDEHFGAARWHPVCARRHQDLDIEWGHRRLLLRVCAYECGRAAP